MSNVYETDRDVLASKVNKKLDTTTISSYFYTVNNLGQRTGVNKDGTAFASTRDIAWGYDSLGQVVKADSSIADQDRAYQYDGIGNRTSGSAGASPASTTSYTPNALNQYTAIGALNPTHDDDGNMTSGPLPANVNASSTFVWDGENRLIEAQVNSGATVSYVYDSQSRRIAETVGSATTVYIYDGWNPIAEYSTTFALTKTYTWGIDLSGTMQGAGGVGGLLAVTDSSGTHYPTFDGNGNVSEYLAYNGNTVAHYEYDPFGKTTVTTGSKVQDFAHRFSTKPLDATTGLYYYGYRFYDPETGRWPSKDPIEERGGVNLYNFVENDGVNKLDLLGLTQTKRNCVTASKSLSYNFNLPPQQVGPFSVGGGISFSGSLQIEKCDECCNGNWESSAYEKGTASGDVTASVSATLGFNREQDLGGGLKASVWAGLRFDGSGGAGVEGTYTSSCNGSKDYDLSGTLNIGGSVSGGGNASLEKGRWQIAQVGAYIRGSVSSKCRFKIKCSGGSCRGGFQWLGCEDARGKIDIVANFVFTSVSWNLYER